MNGVPHIIPYITALSPSQLCWLLTPIQIRIAFAAEEGVDIKTGRETDVTVLSFFLIEGAGREKLSPAGLSSNSNA
jgi:hypothetical protein